MEVQGRIVENATPLLSRQVSSKYSEMSSQTVVRDLSNNHGRALSKDYVQKLSTRVGSLVEQKEGSWSYDLPVQANEVELISIGRDGTTIPIRSEGYREAMNGTISFYNASQERLHTIYIAQAPQYGKANFEERFAREIQKVQSQFEQVHYVGIADGAKDNWSFLDKYVQQTILDYWHVCEYITIASKAYSRSKYEQKQWAKQARLQLKTQQGGAATLLAEMKGFRKKRKPSRKAKEDLEKSITYFTNHLHRMDYADYQKRGLPIGSGVTEAACKVIIKQRTNHSGMRWNIDTAQKVLNIRTLVRTDKRWQQFWNKVDTLGFAA